MIKTKPKHFQCTEELFGDDVYWLINTSDQNETFSNLPLLIYSNFYTFKKFPTYVEVHEIYRKGENQSNFDQEWNLWDIENGLAFKSNNKWDRRSDLSGIVIKAGSLAVSSRIARI